MWRFWCEVVTLGFFRLEEARFSIPHCREWSQSILKSRWHFCFCWNCHWCLNTEVGICPATQIHLSRHIWGWVPRLMKIRRKYLSLDGWCLGSISLRRENVKGTEERLYTIRQENGDRMFEIRASSMNEMETYQKRIENVQVERFLTLMLWTPDVIDIVTTAVRGDRVGLMRQLGSWLSWSIFLLILSGIFLIFFLFFIRIFDTSASHELEGLGSFVGVLAFLPDRSSVFGEDEGEG